MAARAEFGVKIYAHRLREKPRGEAACSRGTVTPWSADSLYNPPPQRCDMASASVLGVGVVLFAGGEDIRDVVDRPVCERPQRVPDCLAKRGQVVFHAHWHFRVDRSPDQAIAFESAQRLGEHLLAHPGQLLPQPGEPARAVPGELSHHENRPFVADPVEHIP